MLARTQPPAVLQSISLPQEISMDEQPITQQPLPEAQTIPQTIPSVLEPSAVLEEVKEKVKQNEPLVTMQTKQTIAAIKTKTFEPPKASQKDIQEALTIKTQLEEIRNVTKNWLATKSAVLTKQFSGEIEGVKATLAYITNTLENFTEKTATVNMQATRTLLETAKEMARTVTQLNDAIRVVAPTVTPQTRVKTVAPSIAVLEPQKSTPVNPALLKSKVIEPIKSVAPEPIAAPPKITQVDTPKPIAAEQIPKTAPEKPWKWHPYRYGYISGVQHNPQNRETYHSEISKVTLTLSELAPLYDGPENIKVLFNAPATLTYAKRNNHVLQHMTGKIVASKIIQPKNSNDRFFMKTYYDDGYFMVEEVKRANWYEVNSWQFVGENAILGHDYTESEIAPPKPTTQPKFTTLSFNK